MNLGLYLPSELQTLASPPSVLERALWDPSGVPSFSLPAALEVMTSHSFRYSLHRDHPPHGLHLLLKPGLDPTCRTRNVQHLLYFLPKQPQKYLPFSFQLPPERSYPGLYHFHSPCPSETPHGVPCFPLRGLVQGRPTSPIPPIPPTGRQAPYPPMQAPLKRHCPHQDSQGPPAPGEVLAFLFMTLILEAGGLVSAQPSSPQ